MKNGCEDEIPLNFSRRQDVGRPKKMAAPVPPRIPRIARLMPLAIKFQDMVDSGEVNDYAEIARLGYVTRARLTQIMNLLLLAPDIQDAWLNANEESGIQKHRLRSAAQHVSWSAQRAVLSTLATPFVA